MRPLAALLKKTGLAAVLASMVFRAGVAGSAVTGLLIKAQPQGSKQNASATVSKALELLRDRQEKDKLAKEAAALAEKARQNSASSEAYYLWAVAESYLAEVLEQTGDRTGAAQAAMRGIPAAERAVALSENIAEHHRILGTLCGQAVRQPAGRNALWALRAASHQQGSCDRSKLRPGAFEQRHRRILSARCSGRRSRKGGRVI